MSGHLDYHIGQQLNAFTVISILGEGSYGRVLKVKNMRTGRLAALKVNRNDDRDVAMAEINILREIGCRDIGSTSYCIKMLSWFNYGDHVCIAFPLLGSSVFDFMKDNDFEPFSIDEVRHIAHQLCSAVLFLHKCGIIHTDLKPENMMFVDSSFTTVDCKGRTLKRLKCTDIRLGDFGLAIRDNDYHEPVITTRYYRPPEVILQLDWTKTCDIWSIGCILVELHTGDPLFPANKDEKHLAMMEAIIGEIPSAMVKGSTTTYYKNGSLDWDWNEAEQEVIEHCRPLENFQLHNCDEADQLFHVIRQMLSHEPHRRILLSEALSMPFF